MLHVLTTQVGNSHPMFGYFEGLCGAANNLKNATRFRQRQVITAVEKDPSALTANEREVLDEIAKALPVMNAAGKRPDEAGDRYKMPTQGKSFLSYPFLEALLRATNNPDFFCGKLPRQAAQAVLKDCVQEMESYYAAKREYRRDPSKFRGEPKFPGYNKPGGCCTTTLTNQDCVLYDAGKGAHELKLPYIKERLSLGKAPIQGRLKQVKVIPTHGIFVISLTTEVKGKPPALAEGPQRIIGIDLGVNNFAAITNNLGKPCLLFKGGVAKSANQWYNKQMAALVSEQTIRTGEKFVPTPESRRLELQRDNYLGDYMNKVAKLVIRWCVENQVDTIVVGVNKGGKQGSNMGSQNNQNFVSLPFAKFRWQLQYRAERLGIRYIEHEESYTSKASFLDGDFIPVYGEDGANQVKFSGQRFQRGLYRSKSGQVLNSDFNGSANTIRKAIPDAFIRGVMPDFNRVLVYKHPDTKPTVVGKSA